MRDDGSCNIVRGCMDENAGNYNENAVQDDGSCDMTTSKRGRFRHGNRIRVYQSGNELRISLPYTAEVMITDIQGNRLFKLEAAKHHLMQLNTLSTGMFILTVNGVNGIVSRKFMIQ